MVKLEPFEIEQWMTRYETTPDVLNIAEVCAASMSIEELVDLNSDKNAPPPLNLGTKLTYGSVPGSEGLRKGISALYSRHGSATVAADDVIVTQGTIAANMLVYYALLGPGDHMVCVYPAFQQLYSLPASLGAEVSLWELKKENGFIPDVAELQTLTKPNTKLIVINNPHNPSGSTTPKNVLEEIVKFAQERGIIILSDDIYSPLFHNLAAGEEPPPSILSFGYEKTISTSSMSKAFSLAGLRLGWIVTRDGAIRQAVARAREYTTITVSQLDDQVASYALSDTVLPNLVARNMALARTNLDLLDAFVKKYDRYCSWVKPTAGTMAFVQFRGRDGEPVDDAQFCVDVLNETKAFVIPGSVAFGGGKDFRGYARFGYVCHTNVLKEGLERLGRYLEAHF